MERPRVLHIFLQFCYQDSVNINQYLILTNLPSIIFRIALPNFLEASCRYLDYNADTHMFGKINPVTLEQYFFQLTRVYP